MVDTSKIRVYYARGTIPGKQFAASETNQILNTSNNLNIVLSTDYDLVEENRLIPAPLISITPEIYYANDTPIGYTYNINLNGYASSIDYTSSAPLPTGIDSYFEKTLTAIQKIKNTFNFNNGIFVVSDSDNNILLKSNGCIIKSLNFENNDNNWINYAKYSVELEANEVQLSGCSGVPQIFGCDSLSVPSGLDQSYSPLLLDMTKYRVKSFNDDWSFNIANENAKNYSVGSFNFNNQFIEVTYKVSAVGKHYATYKNDSDVNLIPAWENAKNFCQDRVYNVVSRLINGVLKVPDEDSLINLFNQASGSGLLYYANSNINDSTFGVYNENITCEASESDGSFDATYKAIIKRKNSGYASHSIHTFTLSEDIRDNGKTQEVSIDVQGQIQGLIQGGLFAVNGRPPGLISLPQHGKLITYNINADENNTKYQDALTGYNLLADSNGLKSNFLSALNITSDSLKVSCGGTLYAASHEVTHNYSEGNITYNTSYTTSKACQKDSKITNITVTIDDPVAKISEFIIPGKSQGPVVQILGNYITPRYITVNIEGYNKNYACNTSLDTPQELLENIGMLTTEVTTDMPFTRGKTLALLENTLNYNRKDGSFTVRRKYLVANDKINIL